MKMKKLFLGMLSVSVLFFFFACTPATEKKVTETKSIVSDVVDETKSPSKKELKEILENTIPDTDNHFRTDEEGLEAFVRYVEEFAPLVELTMIEKIRNRGKFYFTEYQMDRLNKALDETTAL